MSGEKMQIQNDLDLHKHHIAHICWEGEASAQWKWFMVSYDFFGLMRYGHVNGQNDSGMVSMINGQEIVMDFHLKQDCFYEDGNFDILDFEKPNYYKTPLE